jgi:hypothetical protein
MKTRPIERRIQPFRKFLESLSIFEVAVRCIHEAGRIKTDSPVSQPGRFHPMRFLSLYKSPERNTPPTPEEMATMGRLVEEWMKSGKLLATEGCLPSSFGARVRINHDKYTVSDGPFAESKEVVGGFAILDAPTKEAAVEYVKEFLKVVGQGECELRQLYDANLTPDNENTGREVQSVS